MTWTTGRAIGYDLETTGRDPRTARIVSACLVEVDLSDGSVVDKQEWVVNPGVQIPQESIEVHGIDDHTAGEHGLPTHEAVGELVATINHYCGDGAVPLVAYNAPYDVTLLHREAIRHGIERPRPTIRVLDPFVIDRKVDPKYRGSRTLTNNSKHYGVDLSEEDAHDSTADAIAAVNVLRAQAILYRQVRMRSLAELHDAQVGWFRDQAADLQRYLRRTNEDDTIEVDGRWPMNSLTVGEDVQTRVPIGTAIDPSLADRLRSMGMGAARRCSSGSCGNRTHSDSGLCWRHG